MNKITEIILGILETFIGIFLYYITLNVSILILLVLLGGYHIGTGLQKAKESE